MVLEGFHRFAPPGSEVDKAEWGGSRCAIIEPSAFSPGTLERRRPIRARNTQWAQISARALTRLGLRPNQISVLSVVFAACGAGLLIDSGQAGGIAWRAAALLLAGGCVQLRLLCNLLDGLVAVEGGLRTKTGELYNELPDRISDALLLASAGYATDWTGWEHDLGWAAATVAVIVAYTRALGGQMGTTQQFCGPMAKQQRMFVLTLACIVTSVELLSGGKTRAMTVALGLVVLGSIFTAARRTARIARELEAR